MNRVVTIWNKLNNQKNKFIFNHFSDGYDGSVLKPISNHPKQKKDWDSSEWNPIKGCLIYREKENIPPLLIEI